MLKKDSWLLGVALGIIVPAVLYFIIFYGNVLLAIQFNHGLLYLQESTVMLISVFFNMFTMRYYMIKKKYDKTGRGILLVTFIFAAVFFYFYFD